MGKKRVLIVHDDEDLMVMLSLILQSAGYDVVSARTSQEGLDKVQELGPNLVILDAALETASDPQVSLMLRNPAPKSPYASYRHIPILVLTPSSNTTSLRTGSDEAYLPVDDSIEMPIDADMLLDRVRALTGQDQRSG